MFYGSALQRWHFYVREIILELAEAETKAEERRREKLPAERNWMEKLLSAYCLLLFAKNYLETEEETREGEAESQMGRLCTAAQVL